MLQLLLQLLFLVLGDHLSNPQFTTFHSSPRSQTRTLSPQPLQHGNNRQRSRRRLITALKIASRGTSQDSYKQSCNTLVVDIKQACLRPLVVQDR